MICVADHAEENFIPSLIPGVATQTAWWTARLVRERALAHSLQQTICRDSPDI